MKRAPVTPRVPITHSDFAWVPSANTDVRATFERHGWQPPDHAKQREEWLRLNAVRGTYVRRS